MFALIYANLFRYIMVCKMSEMNDFHRATTRVNDDKKCQIQVLKEGQRENHYLTQAMISTGVGRGVKIQNLPCGSGRCLLMISARFCAVLIVFLVINNMHYECKSTKRKLSEDLKGKQGLGIQKNRNSKFTEANLYTICNEKTSYGVVLKILRMETCHTHRRDLSRKISFSPKLYTANYNNTYCFI